MTQENCAVSKIAHFQGKVQFQDAAGRKHKSDVAQKRKKNNASGRRSMGCPHSCQKQPLRGVVVLGLIYSSKSFPARSMNALPRRFATTLMVVSDMGFLWHSCSCSPWPSFEFVRPSEAMSPRSISSPSDAATFVAQEIPLAYACSHI
jgi:hypothetical protein